MEYLKKKMKNNLKYPLRVYEIWTGYYCIDIYRFTSKEPELVGKVKARDFKSACFIFELQGALRNVKGFMNSNFYHPNKNWNLYYNYDTNSNLWTGKYYETYDEALKTFNDEKS